MKQILLLALTGFLAILVKAQPVSTDETWRPTIKFNVSEHHFGTIPEGPKAYHEFVFTNTGKEPVIIERAQASCGCTVPEISKAPVAPGKTGVIKVEYNSEGRPGNFDKTVTVYAKSGINSEKSGSVEIKIKGTVTPKNQAETKPEANPANTNTPAVKSAAPKAKPVQYNPVNKKRGS